MYLIMQNGLKRTALILILIVSITVTFFYSLTLKDSDAIRVPYTISDGTIMYDIYFEDDYFKQPGGQFNPSLVTCSYGLAISSKSFFPTKNDYSVQYQTAEKFMEDAGFEDIRYNDYYTMPSSYSSLGLIIGKKEIDLGDETATLLAITTKSGNYRLEWLNNIDLGYTGNNQEQHHKGFYNCGKREYAFIEEYIRDMNITGNVKIWMAGFSRGAAVTNMTAALIDRNIVRNGTGFEGVQMGYEDVYAYCFETPQGAFRKNNAKGLEDPRSSEYGNIFNLIDQNDPVPMVSMTRLGFTRFGTDMFYPNNLTTAAYGDAMVDMYIKYFPQLPSYSIDGYYQNQFSPMFYDTDSNSTREIKNPSVGLFMREFMRMLVDDVPLTRFSYMHTYQVPINLFFTYLFSGKISGTTLLGIGDFLTVLTDDNNMQLLVYDIIHDSDAFVNDFSSFAEYYSARNGNKISNELIENLEVILTLLTKATANDKSYLLSLMSSGNINSLKNAHLISSSMPWCMAMDPNYGTVSSLYSYNDGRYRRITVEGADDLTLFDEDGYESAVFADGKLKECYSLLTYCTGKDGSMIIYIPLDGRYTLDIEKGEDPKVTVDIYDPNWDIYNTVLTTAEKHLEFTPETEN